MIGLLVFAALCALSLVVGLGFMRLVGLASTGRGSVALAPGIALALWASALFLALLPPVLTACRMLEPTWSRIVLLGLLIGAALYAYPEMLPVLAADALLVAAWPWRSPRARRWAWIAGALAAGAVGLLLTQPYLGEIRYFLLMQYAEYGKRARGGWVFPGLLQPSTFLSALWGLGGETHAEQKTQIVASCGFTLLAAAGLGRAWRRRPELVMVAALHLAGALWMLGGRSYTYAAYKLLSSAAWAMAIPLALGIERLAALVHGARRRTLFWSLAAACVVASLGSSGARRLRQRETEDGFAITHFRALAAVPPLVGPWAVAIDVAQPSAQMWSLYFLRAVPLRVLNLAGYPGMPHLTRRMQRAYVPDWARVRYVLTDARAEPGLGARRLDLLWESAPYKLWWLHEDLGPSSEASPRGAISAARAAW